LIKPWRSFFIGEYVKLGITNISATEIIDWIRQNITISEEENYYKCPISPQGVYELRYADSRSRNILFVATCRAASIPARLETASEKPQYYKDDKWIDVDFDIKNIEQKEKAVLTFNDSKQNYIKPQYFKHYTLARFENDKFITLDYEDDITLKNLPASIQADPGYYSFITGSRAADGSVTVNTSCFAINENDRKNISIELPETEGKMLLYGIVDMNTKINKIDSNHNTLKELSNKQGIMLCFIDIGKEPSKHVLQELQAFNKDLELWGGSIVLMIPNDKISSGQNIQAFKNNPSQCVWAIDANRTLLKNVSETLQLDFTENFPLTLFLNNNGGILYYSEGYRIGTVENMIRYF
jgi:hypothetical protein